MAWGKFSNGYFSLVCINVYQVTMLHLEWCNHMNILPSRTISIFRPSSQWAVC